MDFEEFYSITQEQFDTISIEKLRGIKQYENSQAYERSQLKNLQRVFYVGGIDETIYYRGYIDIWDVWDSDGKLYLRHRVHDSTD
jgi:hypothetical protein